MTDQLNYHSIMQAEMKPDVYAGEPCGSEIKPRFWAYADGDMDGDYTNDLDFSAKNFPPGTKINISVPCCPNQECGLGADYATNGVCECGFDWNEWARDEYS